MFKFIFKIGWASLIQRKLRSFLVILMIASSLLGLLLMQGIYEGMTVQMIENAIRSDSGDISVYLKGYRQDNDLKLRIPGNHQLFELLNNSDQVQDYASRILQDGLVATAHYSQNALLIGVDLQQEKKHGRLDAYLKKGTYSFGPKQRGVILGSRLANKLKADIGNKLIVSAQNTHNEISSLSLKITGILNTNNMLLDSRAILIDRTTAARMLLVGDDVSQVSIMMKNRSDTQFFQQSIVPKLPDIEIFRWDELYPALMQGKVMMDVFNLVTSAIIFGVAGLGIFGVMMVSVLERLREFGILLAIGTTFNQIRFMVLTESILLGTSGFLTGSILGYGTLLYFSIYGLDLSMFKEGIESFGMDAVTFAVIRPAYFITAAIAVGLATVISAVLPLRVLKRLRPIEIIHKV